MACATASGKRVAAASLISSSVTQSSPPILLGFLVGRFSVRRQCGHAFADFLDTPCRRPHTNLYGFRIPSGGDSAEPGAFADGNCCENLRQLYEAFFRESDFVIHLTSTLGEGASEDPVTLGRRLSSPSTNPCLQSLFKSVKENCWRDCRVWRNK